MEAPLPLSIVRAPNNEAVITNNQYSWTDIRHIEL